MGNPQKRTLLARIQQWVPPSASPGESETFYKPITLGVVYKSQPSGGQVGSDQELPQSCPVLWRKELSSEGVCVGGGMHSFIVLRYGGKADLMPDSTCFVRGYTASCCWGYVLFAWLHTRPGLIQATHPG